MVFAVSDLLNRLHALETHESSWTVSAPALATATAVALAAYMYSRVASSSTRGRAVPRPETSLPFLGDTLEVMKQRLRLYDWYSDESLKHGGALWLMTMLGRPRAFVATSPEHFEEVLKDLELFPRGPVTCELSYDMFGRGILAVDGDEWYTQRKISSHLFSLQMMKHVMATVIMEKIAILHRVLLTHAQKRPNEPLSMRQTLTHFTSDVFAKIGFGVELDCMERSLEGDHENAFMDAFSFGAIVIRKRVQQPRWLWHLERFLNVGMERELKEAKAVIDDFMYEIIAKSVAAKNNGTSKNKDLISLFLHNKLGDASEPTVASPATESGAAVDPAEFEQIRDMVISFIFAGKDTTSASMSWFIVMMNRYPGVAAKIRQELREKMPSLCHGELQVPTVEDLQGLSYLEAAIRENLRLNPPVASTARTATKTTTFRDGTVIQKGDMVRLAIYAQARQPNVWGPDAAEFKPERWLDEKTGTVLSDVSPYKFSVFTAGPRICIGRKFAMLEMKIALAVLMSRFILTTVEDPWSITYEMAVTAPVDGPLMVKVVAIDSATAA